jgi:hypothetical protein
MGSPEVELLLYCSRAEACADGVQIPENLDWAALA